ncbi:MAG: ERAP1-like C-terminal domain-containing protein, partial [Myxococcota bacterium]
IGTEAFRSQDVWSMLWPSMGDKETRPIAWSWLMDNYSVVRNKLGDGRAGGLAWFGSSFCTEAKRKEVEVFFSAPSREATGLDRTLPMALETIDRCARSTAWMMADAHVWLESNAPPKP